jgi:hypothetical protein
MSNPNFTSPNVTNPRSNSNLITLQQPLTKKLKGFVVDALVFYKTFAKKERNFWF